MADCEMRGLNPTRRGTFRLGAALEDPIGLLSERRVRRPWGLCSGGNGAAGLNSLNGETIAGKTTLFVEAGDVIKIATAGGGGYGVANDVDK